MKLSTLFLCLVTLVTAASLVQFDAQAGGRKGGGGGGGRQPGGMPPGGMYPGGMYPGGMPPGGVPGNPNNPAVGTTPAPPGGTGSASGTAPGSTTPASSQLTFKDLAVNANFYFLSDTNRTYLWTKTADTKAKNTVNGNEATLPGGVPVKQQ
jgi:hypothetical protein